MEQDPKAAIQAKQNAMAKEQGGTSKGGDPHSKQSAVPPKSGRDGGGKSMSMSCD